MNIPEFTLYNGGRIPGVGFGTWELPEGEKTVSAVKSALENEKLLQDESLGKLAAKYQKTPAQLCIRWSLQHGVLPLPKSLSQAHLKDNLLAADFEIAEEDMKAIDQFPPIGGVFWNMDEPRRLFYPARELHL